MAAWCCLVLGAELQSEVVSEIDFFYKYLPTTHSKMPVQSRPIKHTMPESDEQVQIWHLVKDGCTMVVVSHVMASQCLQDHVI